MKRWLIVFAGVLVTLAVLGFTGVMTGEVVPYFEFKYAANFLGTKTDEVLQQPVFQWAFYVHISTSLLVIFAGLWQFFPKLLRLYPKFHRNTGWVYIVTVLALAGPSGLVLGFFANAGLPSKTGFVLQSIVWWVVTLLALLEIRKQRQLNHVHMMIRSYAITLAAMSLRTESYAMFYLFGTKPVETYLTVTWLSWVGNLLIAETLIYAGWGKWLLKRFKN